MNTEQTTSNIVGQNQQASSRLIGLLTIIIPLLSVIATGVITLSQKRMEIQMAISATQTAEANLAILVISTSVVPIASPSAENKADESTGKADDSTGKDVDVILNNPNADAPSVQLIIKQDDVIIANLILPPGGTVPKINLPPG